MQASEAEQRVKDLEKSKAMERKDNLNKELEELVLQNKLVSLTVLVVGVGECECVQLGECGDQVPPLRQ